MIKDLNKKIIKDKKYIASSVVSPKKVLQKLNTVPEKIIYIIKNKKLIGSITDGDIRRKFIEGISTNEELSKFYNKKPLYLKIDEINKKKINIFLTKKSFIKIIPIVSKKKNYLGVVRLEDIAQEKKKFSKNYDVVIMAGGFGKRLLPITKKIPKPLVKIGKKSVIDNLIERCKKNNINKIYIILHYKAKLIKKHVIKKFPDLKNKFEFIIEKSPLDTAGGIKLINSKKSSKNYLLINSDVVTNINFDDFYNFFKNNKADLIVCTTKNEITIPYGVLKINKKRIKKITEKPIMNFYINSGIYFLNQSIINLIKNGEKISAVELMKRSIKKNKKIFYYPIYENWIDIGNHSDLIKAKNLNN